MLALSTACATAPASSLRPAPGSPAEPAPTTTRLHVAEQWRSESVVASGGSAAPYDYGPTV
ncbi:MAG: beta-xylosidase, partial [Saccharopolyspora sp.]|nr:beta-xylosidase [Saccharopolyspora sp.]